MAVAVAMGMRVRGLGGGGVDAKECGLAKTRRSGLPTSAAAAVAWLANALADYDTELSAGQFVMSGSYTSAVFVHAGDLAATTISGLGSVSVRFI